MRVLRLAVVVPALFAVSCFPLLPGEDIDLSNQKIRLTFLHTSDIHSRLLPYDFAPLKTDTDLGLIPEAGPFGGVTRLASLIKRERASSDRVIHLDSGDSFQGAPIFNVNLGEVEYRWLSRIRVDGAVIGNHEFDAGALNFTNQAKNNASFPVLAANYFWDDPKTLDSNKTALYTQPYTLKNVGGVRVGIIGLANISSLNSIVEGGNSIQTTPLEQNEAVRGYVELLKPMTDLIVIVSHAGLTEDQDLIEGYEAFFEYGKAKSFVEKRNEGDPARWRVLEWFGDEGVDSTVVRVWIPGVIGVDVILGGHLHIILNPPQELTDPAGRKVILAHGGAFSKYLGRLDVVVQMPPKEGAPEMAEVLSHAYRVFPVDGLWCSEALHQYYKERFWGPGQFASDPAVRQGLADCTAAEDEDTTQLLIPYIENLDVTLSLTSLFGYAPRDIARRNNSSGGDSPLGNIAADSMRKRKRVEAEVAVTNSLGIRDNLYAGPLTQESMFNVFPFENTINVMYLSGVEMQEMLDFIAERSADRGCISQAQVSGLRFTMDCAQVQLNAQRFPCDPTITGDANGMDCPNATQREGRAPWQCLADLSGGRCWAHSGTEVLLNGQPLEPFTTYRVAVNDYIAKGGSGFSVLKRNTTRIETGIPLRDSLIGYMQNFCNCTDMLAANTDEHGNIVGKNGQQCGSLLDGQWVIDPQVVSYCRGADLFQKALTDTTGQPCSCKDVFRGDGAACGAIDFNAARGICFTKLLGDAAGKGGPALGKCSCLDALAGNPLCGYVTSQVRAFCENPTAMAVALGVEDGRIKRRVK